MRLRGGRGLPLFRLWAVAVPVVSEERVDLLDFNISNFLMTLKGSCSLSWSRGCLACVFSRRSSSSAWGSTWASSAQLCGALSAPS